ncbi:MAG: hypothetical protein AAF674_21690 [Pseudomonadota bacterium]
MKAARMHGRAGLIWTVLAGLPVVCLYIWVGATSPGFDDEIWTLRAAERAPDIKALLYYLRTEDVHPPLSYLLPWAWMQAGLSPEDLRAAIGAMVALSLVVLWRVASPVTGLPAAFAFLVICLNPTLLLWGATLRWYSLALPMMVTVLVILRVNPASPGRFWGALSLLGVLMGYTAYACLLFLPGVLLAALWRRGWPWRQERVFIALACLGVIAALLPQIVYVMPDQLALGQRLQDHGWLRQVGGLIVHLLMGHASMPLSMPSIAMLLGSLLLFAAAVWRCDKALITTWTVVLIPGLLMALLLGIAASFRNLTVLIPAQALWQSTLFHRTSSRPIVGAVFGLFAAGTAVGLWNVVAHEDTSKGSWNRPYWEILDVIEAARDRCPDLSVVSHDPVLRWHLSPRDQPMLDIPRRGPEGRVLAHPGCLLVVESYSVRAGRQYMQSLRDEVAQRPGQLSRHELGYDRHAEFKRLFIPRMMDHAAVVTVFAPLASP